MISMKAAEQVRSYFIFVIIADLLKDGTHKSA